LGVRVHVEASVDISFGLGFTALVFWIAQAFNEAKELFMSNANVLVTTVWCGITFLREPGGERFQPKREMRPASKREPPKSELWGFDSSFPH